MHSLLSNLIQDYEYREDVRSFLVYTSIRQKAPSRLLLLSSVLVLPDPNLKLKSFHNQVGGTTDVLPIPNNLYIISTRAILEGI